MISMEKLEWKNERRKIADLVPWDKNPRKISDEQLEHLKRSIEKFNYAAPIVITPLGRIVAGHMRLKALLALGRGDEEVDVRVASRELSKEEYEELVLRDNQNTGDWDLAALAGFDEELLRSIGFEEEFLDALLDKAPREAKGQIVKCPKCEHAFPRKGNSA